MNRLIPFIGRLTRSIWNAVLFAGKPASTRRLATTWRALLRIAAILIGLAIFVTIEVLLSRGIVGEQYYLMVLIILGLSYALLAIKSPLAALLVWIVVSPLSKYFLETRFASGMNFLTFDTISFFLLFAVLAFRGLASRTRFRWPSFGESLLIAFVIYILLSMLIRGDFTPNQLKIFFLKVGSWPVIYYCVRACIKNERDVHKFITALLISATVGSVAMIYEHFAGQSVYSLVFHQKISLALTDVAEGRACGFFVIPFYAAELLVPCIYFGLQRLVVSEKWHIKCIYAGLILLNMMSVYYTYTRANYVSLGILLILAPLLSPYRRKAYLVATAIVVVVAAAVVMPYMATDQKMQRRMTNDTMSDRMVFQHTSMNMIKDNPLFGVGWGNSFDLNYKYLTSMMQYGPTKNAAGMAMPLEVHNTYLFITQENGIIGAVLYYGAVLAMLFATVKTYRNNAPASGSLGKNFLAIVIASTIMWFVATQVYSNDNAVYVNLLFWSYFALASRYKDFLPKTNETRQVCADKHEGLVVHA